MAAPLGRPLGTRLDSAAAAGIDYCNRWAKRACAGVLAVLLLVRGQRLGRRPVALLLSLAQGVLRPRLLACAMERRQPQALMMALDEPDPTSSSSGPATRCERQP
jgi:hypothetical protein